MQYINLILLISIIFYVWQSNRTIHKKIETLAHLHSTLFWTLKNKEVINIHDWNEGKKITHGERTGHMSLKDFIDLNEK